MADVFISYKREDLESARAVAFIIEARGYTTWWDNSLIAGEQFNSAIDRELKAARCVITLWSRAAADSKWVTAEALHAFDRSVLVSARLDDVELVYPFGIIQAANLQGWNRISDDHPGVADILAGVAVKVGPREPLPAQASVGTTTTKIGPRSHLPSLGWRPDTDFFAERVAQAFPGAREITWFDDPASIAMRLDKLLEPPLDFEELTPIWWLRGSSNLHIERYRRLDDRLVLFNWEELLVRRVAVSPSMAYQRVFVYLEADGMPPTGLYPPSAPSEFQCQTEEYAIYNGSHLITRAEYDDGATIIDGQLIDVRGNVELRVRHVSPYNVIIAANGSPLNNSTYDPELEATLDSALNSRVDADAAVEKIAQDIVRLRRPSP